MRNLISTVIIMGISAFVTVFPSEGYSAAPQGGCEWVVRYRFMAKALTDLSRAHQNIDRIDTTELTYIGANRETERYRMTVAIYSQAKLIKEATEYVKISFQTARGYKVCLHQTVDLDR